MTENQSRRATPQPIKPRSHRIRLEDLEVDADVGFHDFEVGVTQRLLISVDVSLDLAHWPAEDTAQAAWNYDFIREEVKRMVSTRRYNLQEILVQEIFELIAARPGVVGLTICSRKPDVYPDAGSVGVIISSD